MKNVLFSSAKYVILLSILVFGSSSFAYAQLNIDNILTAHTPENYNYLRYNNFRNVFDSATIECTIGEFRVKINGVWKNVPLHLNFNGSEISDTVQGEQIAITTFSKTVPFSPVGATEIKFFRKQLIGMPCGTQDPPWRNPSVGEACAMTLPQVTDSVDIWNQRPWRAPYNSILDTTEFVIRLVRASNNQVLAIIDSVGILPNGNSYCVPRYGFQPVLYNHTRPFPAISATDSVYFSIVPKRRGASQYGIGFMQASSDVFPYSARYEYSPTGPFRISKADVKRIDSAYFSRLIAYCDSIVLSSKPCLPFFNLTFSPGQDTIYRSRYYNYVGMLNGMAQWEEKHCNISSSVVYPKKDFGSMMKTLEKSLDEKQYIVKNGQSIDVNIPESQRGVGTFKLSVYTTLGTLVKVLWQGSTSALSIPISTDQVSSGVYYIVLSDSNGRILDSESYIVSR